VTITQAAEKWQLSRSRVRELIREGRVPVQQFSTPDGQKIVVIPDNMPKPPPKDRR
jgi:hypothetical protein